MGNNNKNVVLIVSIARKKAVCSFLLSQILQHYFPLHKTHHHNWLHQQRLGANVNNSGGSLRNYIVFIGTRVCFLVREQK